MKVTQIKKSILLITVLVMVGLPIKSQSPIELFLTSVEENNPQLVAARELMQAEIIHTKTGLLPDNPEIEYGYMPGSESAMGTKTIFGVSQSFDFPTTYFMKYKVANQRSISIATKYEIDKQNVLLQAKKLYYQYIFLTKKKEEYNNRLENAEKLYQSLKSELETGNTSVLEANKAKVLHLSMKSKYQIISQDLKNLKSELTIISGNNESLDYPATFTEVTLNSLDSIKNEYLINAPELQYLNYNVELSKMNHNLSKQQWLPDFSVGYESEKESEGTFAGVKAGISIPLWKNKNSIKYSKANYMHAQTKMESHKLLLLNELERKYQKAEEYKKILNEYISEFSTSDIGFIEKAFSSGQISIIEYVMELTFFYDITDQYLETEKNYYQTLAELYRYQL